MGWSVVHTLNAVAWSADVENQIYGQECQGVDRAEYDTVVADVRAQLEQLHDAGPQTVTFGSDGVTVVPLAGIPTVEEHAAREAAFEQAQQAAVARERERADLEQQVAAKRHADEVAVLRAQLEV